VTNLENGQSVCVRINDRGPHKRHRILDLSYEAARQIDLVRRGAGRVQIDFLAEPALVVQPALTTVDTSLDQRNSVQVIETPGAEPALVVQPTLTTVDTSPDQRNSVQVIETPGMEPLALPGGAYQEQNNAVRVVKPLTTMYPNVWLSMAPEGAQPLHRIGLGPFNSHDEAERVVHAVKARGYTVQVIAMTQ
jgi:rare lipoprotein A